MLIDPAQSKSIAINLSDLHAIAQHIANRAVVTALRDSYCLLVACGENVLLLDDKAARLGELVDSIKLHSLVPAVKL